jgi:small GTP-binding protein
VLIGASASGKTSLLLRFIEEKFTDSYLCTIGVDFKIKTLQVDNMAVKLQVWDTAGQERFKSISQAYYRNSHGCVAVYDICSRTSFESISEQISNFINYSPQDCQRNIVLVGNKLDLEDSRQVKYHEGLELAKKLGLAGFVETSAKDGSQSLDDAFFITCVNAFDNQFAETMLPMMSSGKQRPRLFTDQSLQQVRNKEDQGKQRELLLAQLRQKRTESDKNRQLT